MDSMDVNEITKVIDGVYKNITDNFNPASKQMIATGKAYLKSLHGASAACSMYLEALAKLSKQAQQSSVGTSLDIGSSMMQIADVFKEIHTQQLTTLKAFYVDFLVPLETNLEKDVKVIQNEQKKFLVSHKHRVESYNKAVSNAKKVRKKSKKSSHPSSSTLDKEIRIMQAMEEERSKLEAFCEEALREALTQERRRYGFILERQASLAKHYLSFYTKGGQSLGQKLDQWMKVAKSREALPENMQTNLVKKIQQQGEEECIYCSPRRPADDTASISSQLRKTKSMEAGEMLNIQNSTSSHSSSGGVCGGIGNYHLTAASSRGGGTIQNHHQDLPITSAGALSRAKSDTSLGMINGGNGGGIYGTTGLALVNDHHPSQHFQQQQQQQGPPAQSSDNFRSKSMALSPVGPSPSLGGGNSGSTSSNQEPGHVGYAKALYAYLSNGDNQLCFLEGDIIALIGDRNRGWQFGENLRTQKMGWFPVAYTESLEQPQNRSVADLIMMSKHSGVSPVPPPMPPPIPSANNNSAGGGGPRTPESHANKGIQKPGAKNLMIPSNRTNDSLHSSNDSGFSNDVGHPNQAHHLGHHGQVPPPPQPEIDYSDEEPHLSNSEEIKPGNKWLMDRYHMSESARITNATRRRSLSSGNLSTSDREQPDSLHSSMMLRNNNLRNSTAFVHNGAGNSPRGAHHQLATANTFYDESKEGGALKKFLNRTKSLIWRRPSNAGDQPYNSQNGNDSIRMQRPQRALESISCADTVSELWGSHSSIVEMAEFEMKDMSPSSTMKREMMTMTDEIDDSNGAPQDNDYYANGNIIKNRGGEQKKTHNNSREQKQSNGVPTLPPRNDKTRSVNQSGSMSSKMQHSPGSSSTNSNISIPKEADNSCLVVSDHTRAVKKGNPPVDYGVTSYQSGSTNNRSMKENDIDTIQQQQQQSQSKGQRNHNRERDHQEREEKQRSTRGEKVSSSHSSKPVTRVESFAVSEAPIIPENSAKFSRRNIANGSVALSTKTSRSRGTTITNENQSEMNEALGASRGRRKIWEEHAINDDEFNSEDEKGVDEEEDEGTIDFNDNDEYDEEEAASSVFMEAENEQEQQQIPSNNKMSNSNIMQKHSNKEPKNLQCSISAASSGGVSKRSKSSDVTVRTDNSRRSRSSSTRTHGMDTVDMPKRHGGFLREKVSRSAAVQNGLDSVASRSTSKSRHHHAMRSASSPSQRNDLQQQQSAHKKEMQKERKSNAQQQVQSKKSSSGPMYKGRPIGSPPPIPAPSPNQHHHKSPQQPSQPPPPPPPLQQPSSSPVRKFVDASTEANGDLTEAEPDYGTIKGSPSPSRKDDLLSDESLPPPQQQKHQLITMKQTIVPYAKHQSLVIRDSDGRKAAPRGGAAWKGSIRSEIHTVELITTTDVQGGAAAAASVNGVKPVYDYGSFIRRRLYYPDRGSRLDQKSERSGNYCGPWYDLWGEDPSVSVG